MVIPEWMDADYYPSKNSRMDILKEYVRVEGLERLVVAIAATALHTPQVQTIQKAVGYLQAFLPYQDAFHRAVTAGELLALFSISKTGFFYIKRNGHNPATLVVNHWPFINQQLGQSFDWINDTLFNPPLKAPPVPVKDNFHCGYHTLNEPLLLGDLTMHGEKQDYQAINELNEIQWLLDEEVLKEPEVPSRPLQTAMQHQVFSDMANDSQFVYSIVGKDPFWLCWQYDTRGRMYSHGYHINFQAAEYKKALLSFNKFEYLTGD
jgi:hypothetical protein